MRVFLHIGSHKTGTTAIQEFASQNYDWLREHKLLYPSFDLIGGRRERSHLGLINRIIERNSLVDDEDVPRFLLAARAEAEALDANILFSAESLFRLGQARVDRVNKLFRDAFEGCQITTVASLRPRAAFAESLFRNRFRALVSFPEPFVEWMESASSNFEYEQRIFAYVNGIHSDLALLPYSDSNRENFVSVFFRVLGVELEGTGKRAREKNPSLDVVDCLAKVEVMSGKIDENISRAFNNFAFKNRISSGYGFLDTESEAEFRKRFSEEDARLIALEPSLEEVLGYGVRPMQLRRIDEECMAAVRDRVAAFRANRDC